MRIKNIYIFGLKTLLIFFVWGGGSLQNCTGFKGQFNAF